MFVATTTVTRDTGVGVQSHGEVTHCPGESDHPLQPALCDLVHVSNWATKTSPQFSQWFNNIEPQVSDFQNVSSRLIKWKHEQLIPALPRSELISVAM